MPEMPFEFFEIPDSWFPFTVYMTVAESTTTFRKGELYETYDVSGPGAITILGTGSDPKLDVTIIFPDGEVITSRSKR